MPKMDYLNAYCRPIMTGEEAEQFKSRAEIWKSEIDEDKTPEEGDRLQEIYSNVPVKQLNHFFQCGKWVEKVTRCRLSTPSIPTNFLLGLIYILSMSSLLFIYTSKGWIFQIFPQKQKCVEHVVIAGSPKLCDSKSLYDLREHQNYWVYKAYPPPINIQYTQTLKFTVVKIEHLVEKKPFEKCLP